MENLVKNLKKLVKHHEVWRKENPKSSNSEIRQVFEKLKKELLSKLDPFLTKQIDIQWGLGSSRLPKKPVLYFLSKVSKVKPSNGIYLAIIVDTLPKEDRFGSCRILLTQGYSKQLKDYINEYSLSESKAKKKVLEEARALAYMIGDAYYNELKNIDFNVASTDDVSSDLIIAERVYKTSSQIDDSEIVDDINNLLRVYLNMSINITNSNSENGQSITDAYRMGLAQQRIGQEAFKRKLITKYGASCMLTGCKIPMLIEAAHIVPFSESFDNDGNNGLLLRADIHKLFDCYLIGIDHNGEVHIASYLKDTDYKFLDGVKLAIAVGSTTKENLKTKFEMFSNKNLLKNS